MTHRDLDTAREFIRQADYGSALELLTQLTPHSDEVAQQFSRFSLMEKQHRVGMIDNEEFHKQCAALSHGLLRTIENLRKTTKDYSSGSKPSTDKKEMPPPKSEDMENHPHIYADHANPFDFLLDKSNRLTDCYEKSLRWDWEILTDLHQAGATLTDLVETLQELKTWLVQQKQTLSELYELVNIGLDLVEKAETDYLKLLVHDARVGIALRAKTKALQKNISEIVLQLHVKLQIASEPNSDALDQN